MLAWPHQRLGRIRQEVLRRARAGAQDSTDRQPGRTSGIRDDSASLVASGLVHPEGDWTELGQNVSDLLLRESWQEQDEVQGLLHDHLDLLRGAVLDVGCSTGWALRQIRHARRRVGVDVDQDALALGYRMAELEGQAVEFRYASAHSLPFDDGAFDCVICRNTLTYTHQQRALEEMIRVLKRSGMLFLRYENYRYDIRQLLHCHTPKAWCCRVRDLVFGLLHATTGYQRRRGAPLAPGRVFGSMLWIRRFLRAHNCYITQVMDSRECPRLLGRATQTSLLAYKI